MQQLLRAHPELVPELQRLLDETLTPQLAAEERDRVVNITMNATASGEGRVFQAARDQHISEG